MHHIYFHIAATKAATNMAPSPHPPCRQIERVHLDNFLSPRQSQKVFGGVENSPPMQPSSL